MLCALVTYAKPPMEVRLRRPFALQPPAAFADENEGRSATFTPRSRAARAKVGAEGTVVAGLVLGTALNAGAGFGTLLALYPMCYISCSARFQPVPSALLLGLSMGLPSGAVTVLTAALQERGGRLWVPLVVGPLFAAAQISLAFALGGDRLELGGVAPLVLVLTTPLTGAFASVVAYELTIGSMEDADGNLATGPRWFPTVGVTPGGAMAGAAVRF